MIHTIPARHPDPVENQRLDVLHRLRVLNSRLEERFGSLVQQASQALRTPLAAFALVDRDHVQVAAAVGIPLCEVPRESAFSAQAAYLGEMLEVCDALDDTRFASNPFVVAEPFIRFYAGAPVRAASGHVVGTLCVMDAVPRKLSDSDRFALTHLGECIAGELLTRSLMLDLPVPEAAKPLTAARRAGSPPWSRPRRAGAQHSKFGLLL